MNVRSTTHWFLVAVLLTVGLVFGGCESDLARRVSKYQRMNDDAAAKKLLRRTVRREPGNAEAQFLLGKLYMRQGAYEKGVSAFEKSRAESPRFKEQIAYLKKRYARKEFQKARKALTGGAYSRAEAAFRAVLTIQPSNVAAAKGVGQALVKAGRQQEARTAYRRALELAPKNVEILNNLSALAVKASDYTAAITYTRRALKQSSAPPVLRKRLAYALVETEQWSKAIRQFEKVLQVAPSPQLRRDYAFLLYNREKYQRALPALQRLSSGSSPSLDVLRALGETYGALGRPEGVADVYSQILDRRPEDAAALQRLIMAHERMGEEKTAQEYRDRLQRVRTDEDP